MQKVDIYGFSSARRDMRRSRLARSSRLNLLAFFRMFGVIILRCILAIISSKKIVCELIDRYILIQLTRTEDYFMH